MGMYPTSNPDFTTEENASRTKQSFKDSCDANKIVKLAAKTGSLSHLQTWGGNYGDFEEFDFYEAQQKIAEGQHIFEALPAPVRREFGMDPAQFFAYVTDPANKDRLDELLPDLAQPGRQFPNIQNTPQPTDPTPKPAPVEPEPGPPVEPPTPTE